MLKTFIVMLTATLAASIGETLLSAGMKNIGDFSRGQVMARLLQMFYSPKVILGVLLMVVFFFLYSAALSWADLSLVLPLSSMSFIFGAILAKFVLLEEISFWRWSGIVVIMIGVALVSRGPHVMTFPVKEQVVLGQPTLPPEVRDANGKRYSSCLPPFVTHFLPDFLSSTKEEKNQ